MRTLVAGVDSSTQSCKIVIRDSATGELVREGAAAHPDGTQVHPDAWWDAFLEASRLAGGLDDVSAISVGGQQHGLVALDENGEVIRPAMLWNDTSSAPDAEDLVLELGEQALPSGCLADVREAGSRAWAKRVGLVPVASFTITKLRYVARVEPQNATKIAAVCLPHDWLSWRIAGYGPKSQALDPDLDAIWTDRSDASGTGYFNSVTNEYDLDLVKLALGRSNIILPRVLRPNEVGAVASSKVAGSQVGAGAGGSGAAGSPSAGCAGAIVGAGGGDNAMAAFGLELEVGDVSVSLGTSGVVAVVANKQSNDASGLIAGFADCTGNFLPLVCTLNASRVLDAIKAVLGLGYDELSEQALSAEIGAGGITLVPYFEGERTPNRPNSNATIFGLTLENSLPSNFARAAVEGMLLSLRFGMDSFKAQGILPRKITLVGGGSKLVAVQQLISDVFGIAVYIPADGQYVADGAARQAAWALATLRGEEATGEARSDAPSGGEGGSGGSGVGAAGSASSSSASVPPPHWDIRAGKTFTPNINAAEKYHALAARYNTLAAQDSAGEIGV